MGGSASIASEEIAEKKLKNKQLEKELAQQAQKEAMKFKLLLLGAGESGKR